MTELQATVIQGECKERELVRCAAHNFAWCDLNIAIGVGGGFGVLFIFIGAVWSIKETTSFCVRFPHLISFFLVLSLPWTAGVVVWGGVRALPVVAAMWGSAFILASCSFCVF